MDREFIIVLVLFILTSITVVALPEDLRNKVASNVRESLKPFEELGKNLGATSLLIFPLIIFYNNIRVALINIIGGFILIPPIAITIYNSYIITSFVLHGNVVNNLVLILPHGIIELYAILLSASLGLKIGWAVITRKVAIFKIVKYSLRKFTLITLLLLIAAFIEVYITPIIFAIVKFFSELNIANVS